jgi:curved DNA-binding protein CbpA
MTRTPATGSNMNPYELLGLDQTATDADIKKAYRAKAQDLHPDHGGNDSEFRAVNEAYKILIDPEKRKRLDAGETAADISKTVQTEEQKITNFLVNGFFQVINFCNPNAEDLVARLKNLVVKKIAEIKGAVANEESDIAKLELVAGKIKAAESENIFAAALRSQINDRRRKIETMNGDIRWAEKALKLLDDFSYEIDPALQAPLGMQQALWGRINFNSGDSGQQQGQEG